MAQASSTKIIGGPRWLRFNLRSLLFFVTLICASLGYVVYGMHWKQKRQQFREQGHVLLYTIVDARFCREFETNAPLSLRLLGEKGEVWVEAETEKHLAEARRLFPEAVVCETFQETTLWGNDGLDWDHPNPFLYHPEKSASRRWLIFGEALTRWSIDLALVLCAGSAVLRLWKSELLPQRGALARRLWTAGLVCYLMHVAAAFEFHYLWSHEIAARFTNERAQKVLGFNACGGIWFNYAFTLAWIADVLWWNVWPNNYAVRPAWLRWTWNLWFAGMVFFATVVFETGLIRWAGAVMIAGLVALAVLKAYSSTAQQATR